MAVQEQRASVDPYGSAGDRTSRTMQLAYSDPCESLVSGLIRWRDARSSVTKMLRSDRT